MNSLFALDHKIFHLINFEWSNSFFDWFMPYWTDLHKNKPVFIPLIIMLLGATFLKFRWNALFVAAGAVAAALISDFLSSHFLKLYFLRSRPQNAQLDFTVLTPGASYGGTSFPSSHSLVFFCVAAYLSYFEPRLRWVLLICGFITAYSRIYVAAHFPLDVVGGAAFGYAFGACLARLTEFLFRRSLSSRYRPS